MLIGVHDNRIVGLSDVDDLVSDYTADIRLHHVIHFFGARKQQFILNNQNINNFIELLLYSWLSPFIDYDFCSIIL